MAMATPGFIPWYFEGRFCDVGYNVDRVARQLGYDQGLASTHDPMFPPDDDIELVKNCYQRFVFKPNGPRYCRDRIFILSVPSTKVPPKFTQTWCTNWYNQLTRMIEFLCDVANPVGTVSPHELNARGRIKLDPEVAAAAGIKSGSRGKSSGAAQKGKNTTATVSQVSC